MSGKQRNTVRKPATKYAHLQKKMTQQKTGRNAQSGKTRSDSGKTGQK